jgi:hypothetical protein
MAPTGLSPLLAAEVTVWTTITVLTLLRRFLARRVEKLSHSWRVLKVIIDTAET